VAEKLSVQQHMTGLEGLPLGDFWSWAYSDVLNNRNRSLLAEFLVATALDLQDQPRVEWDAVDLRYQGKGLEIKSAAYLQSWKQERLSVIRYDIARKLGWDAETNVFAPKPTRSADCYVFCLYPETDPARINVLDANAWQFYVLSTEQIEQELGDQKSIGLKGLQALCQPVGYGSLRERIDLTLAAT
jgi:hypothetical protein